MCCGNHLSQEAVNSLQHDGNPCPICNDPQLNSYSTKQTLQTKSERDQNLLSQQEEWVGVVINEVKQHSDSCPKRPWQCQYCDLGSSYDIGVVCEHLSICTKYPVVCPISCEVGSVPRCDLEAHLMVCPLQPVTCEHADVGVM